MEESDIAKAEAAAALTELMEADGGASKGGRWTTEEIDRLNRLVPPGNKPIMTSWVEIATHFPTRSAKQCRERYFQHHVEKRKKGVWTKEEDEIIDSMHKQIGNKWSMIAAKLKGRTDNDVKNRYWSRDRSRKRSKKVQDQIKGKRDASHMESSEPHLNEPSTKKRRKTLKVRSDKDMPDIESVSTSALKKSEETLKCKPSTDMAIHKPPSASKLEPRPPAPLSSSSTTKASSHKEEFKTRHAYISVSDTPVHELSLCDAYALYESKPTGPKVIAYRGVTYDAQTGKYDVTSFINGKDCHLGSYALNADAAYTSDVAEKLLRGPSGNLNFESRDDYFKAREAELLQKGGDADQGDLCSDIDGMVKLVLMKISSEFTSSTGCKNDCYSGMLDEVVVPQQNEDQKLEPTSLNSLAAAAAAASMASDSPISIQYPRPNAEAAVPMSDTAIKLTPEQTHSLPFPMGCKVLADPKLSLFGRVTGVQWIVSNGKSSHKYEVTIEQPTILLENNQLAYASCTPIVYSPSGLFDNSQANDMLFGEIINCQQTEIGGKMECSYTILIDSGEEPNANSSKVIKDVPSRQIKYRDNALEASTSLGESNKQERTSNTSCKKAPSPSTQENMPNSKKSHWPAFRVWSDESEIFDTVSEPTDLDVLRGRGGATNGHPGNMKFRDEAIKLCPEYGHVNTGNERKNELMGQLVQTVKSYGGRFLEKGKDGQWCVLSDKLARYKAAQVLRDLARTLKSVSPSEEKCTKPDHGTFTPSDRAKAVETDIQSDSSQDRREANVTVSLKSVPPSQERCTKLHPDTSTPSVTANAVKSDTESDSSQDRREIKVMVRADNELSPVKLLASPDKSYFRASSPRVSLPTLQDPPTNNAFNEYENIKHRAINARIRVNNQLWKDDLVAFVADESFFSDSSCLDDSSSQSNESFTFEIVSCEEEDDDEEEDVEEEEYMAPKDKNPSASPRRKGSARKKKIGSASSHISRRYASSAVFEPASTLAVEPTDLDVLKGRGGMTNHHKGNVKFRDEARKMRNEYRGERTTRQEKFELSLQLVEIVKNYGGRFLEKGEDGHWHLMSTHAERKKASQVLREEKWD